MYKQDMVIHAIKYVSKKKEILIHAPRCMNLEYIMLTEISQSQKDKYCVIPLTRYLPRVIKLVEAESSTVVTSS